MPSGIFKQFNSFFDRIFRGTENAQIVGFHKQITGEFPVDIRFDRLYEFYHGWAAVHTAVNVTHQKFMGAGIKISSKSKKFNEFVKTWWEVVNADKKTSQMFLSGWITGNGILERQYSEEGKMVNIEHIPLTTIFKIFRDSYGNELKLQQLVDGVLLDLDPKFYGHWSINNPDREAFGKSIFHSIAVARRITTKVDPLTGQPLNPDRTTISILDAQAKLQAAEVEIKDKMSKPKIFASFPGMPVDQLQRLEAELQDGNSDKYVWAFSKEAKIAEVQINPSSKFDQYGANVNEQIDLAMSFGAKVITHPGGFGYASAQTSVDVLDQYVAQQQAEAIEFIRDEILRPLAESWGWKNFDDLDVKVVFQPTIRKLRLEDIIMIPDNVVSVLEKREMLVEQNIPLNEELYLEAQSQLPQQPAGDQTPDGEMPPLPKPKLKSARTTPERPPVEKERPKLPEPTAKLVEHILKNPTAFVKYLRNITESVVEEKIMEERLAEERVLVSPLGNAKADHDDQFMGRMDTQKPEVTDSEIAMKMVRAQDDPNSPLNFRPGEDDDLLDDDAILDEPEEEDIPQQFKSDKYSPDQIDVREEPTAPSKRSKSGRRNV